MSRFYCLALLAVNILVSGQLAYSADSQTELKTSALIADIQYSGNLPTLDSVSAEALRQVDHFVASNSDAKCAEANPLIEVDGKPDHFDLEVRCVQKVSLFSKETLVAEVEMIHSEVEAYAGLYFLGYTKAKLYRQMRQDIDSEIANRFMSARGKY